VSKHRSSDSETEICLPSCPVYDSRGFLSDPLHCNNLRISTDILGRVFRILTEPVPFTFVSVNRRNNEARVHHARRKISWIFGYFYSVCDTSPIWFREVDFDHHIPRLPVVRTSQLVTVGVRSFSTAGPRLSGTDYLKTFCLLRHRPHFAENLKRHLFRHISYPDIILYNYRHSGPWSFSLLRLQ